MEPLRLDVLHPRRSRPVPSHLQDLREAVPVSLPYWTAEELTESDSTRDRRAGSSKRPAENRGIGAGGKVRHDSDRHQTEPAWSMAEGESPEE